MRILRPKLEAIRPERPKTTSSRSRTGGANDHGNYVLACSKCNGDEKLGERWETFLRRKNPDKATFLDRKAKIKEWLALNARNRKHIPDVQRRAVLDAFADRFRTRPKTIDANTTLCRTVASIWHQTASRFFQRLKNQRF